MLKFVSPHLRNGSSLHTTPEPSPRMSYNRNTLQPNSYLKSNGNTIYGSDASLASSSNYNSRGSITLNKWNQVHGSMSSLASSTPRHRKGRAPDIPNSVGSTPKWNAFSANNSPSHSMRSSTLSSRKKRIAPLPPGKQTSLFNDYDSGSSHYLSVKFSDDSDPKQIDSIDSNGSSINVEASLESSYVSTSTSTTDTTHNMETQIISDESKSDNSKLFENSSQDIDDTKTSKKSESQQRLIKVDSSLIDEFTAKSLVDMPAEERITYRRKIVADPISPFVKSVELTVNGRQCEKMKENKESQNKNRQSQLGAPVSMNMIAEESNQLFSPNKSSFGKWKRRKGPAPSLPIPARKVIQMLPLEDIRHELEVIEVQQLGLEKQGVMLEKMIRERCEGTENENKPLSEFTPNSKEAEDLILQLFELVNEKNELFRRQAELMYL